MTVMLETGSDRIGALDFRAPSRDPSDGDATRASLHDLMELADLMQAGSAVPDGFRRLVSQLASVGGARPKALLTEGGRKLIAKFSVASDSFPVIRGEYVAMRLAACARLDVAPVDIVRVEGRDILIVERFDRVASPCGRWSRRALVSALTWTGEHELSAHHISYHQLAEVIEGSFEDAHRAHRELFERLVYNILVGNTDDHARNHAAFWTGATLELTPAYDIAPQVRRSREANQALVLANGSRASQLRNAALVAPAFGVTTAEFSQIADRLITAITENWTDVCDEAGLSSDERRKFAGRQFLNEFAFEGFCSTPHLQ